MAVPTVPASTPMADPTAASSFVVDVPAVQAGDYVVIPIISNEEEFLGFNISDASYTKLFNYDGIEATYTVFIKEVSSAAGASQVTITGDEPTGLVTGRGLNGVFIVRGADPGLVSEFQAGNYHSLAGDPTTGSSTMTFPSVEAASAETLLLCFAGTLAGTTGVTYPTGTHTPNGMTVLSEASAGSSVAAQRYHGAFQQNITSQGATGARTMSKPTLGTQAGGLMAFPFGAAPADTTTETLRPDAILENTEPSETPAGRSNTTLLTDLQRDVP